MKKLSITLLAIIGIGFASCSKCYECAYEVEVEVNGVIEKDTVTDDFCTATGDELNQREAEGQTCSVSS